MKKILSIITLFLIVLSKAQGKNYLNKGEITIPIGQKVILKPEIKNNKITNFEIVKEVTINEKIDLFNTLENFKKDEVKDNSIELTFTEAQMITSTIYALIVIQKTGKKMIFKAKMKLQGNSTYQSTSIMPAVSNTIHVEQWKDHIDSIILYDFELKY
ncbi:hypothetical protein VUJ46_08470 [Chryseobacterium sp. MYb264]|uniref:hypothetical protein n=1 Tax=Chryseobacterium sp. MYb264 TaxID=2745153 RepID=UPI002E164E28|nr:hypothetical protein VUJ46_08470 [Chryseobacterium sp. MYb264]